MNAITSNTDIKTARVDFDNDGTTDTLRIAFSETMKGTGVDVDLINGKTGVTTNVAHGQGAIRDQADVDFTGYHNGVYGTYALDGASGQLTHSEVTKIDHSMGHDKLTFQPVDVHMPPVDVPLN